MAIDLDIKNPVTMFFEIDRTRQEPTAFSTYREAIVAVMETVAHEDRETAIICGKWITIKYPEIAQHYSNLNRKRPA